VLARPFLDLLLANAVGQFRHGIIGYICEPCPSQQVDYVLPPALHQDNLLASRRTTAADS
jgi:hypothetical protein